MERGCDRCGKPSGRRLYCGNACKVATYKARHPDRVKVHRAREADKVRVAADLRRACCRCGAPVGSRRRTCDACKRMGKEDASRRRNKLRPPILRPDLMASPCARCGASVGYAGNGKPRRWCRVCAANPPMTESRRERNRANKRRRECLKRQGAAENVNYRRVFDRDGWRCYICGVGTPPHLRGTCDARAPELEHIIPLVDGGHHTYANTACACRRCNQAKGIEESRRARSRAA